MKKEINILCTRLLDVPVVNKAIQKGIFIDCMPFIRTEFMIDGAIAEKVKQLANTKINAVFTSAKAVDGVAGILGNIVPDWNIYCTGGATKKKVNKLWGDKVFVVSGKHAVDIKNKIIADATINEVVFFCGDQRMNDIPENLPLNGIAVDEMIVYKTILTPKIINKDYDGIMFFSPSAAHSFFSDNTIKTDVVLFSIGQTTSEIIKTYSANEIVTSEWPGQETLVDQIIQYFDVKVTS
ncbi:uroporphyrinogen-III synthase [Rhizosphaericola mali]|uniref:Uroporphyrinogen-III synthase n=1 Tax=Rhizosphaericola mali TaxID=2545455 RepID=A0A5P2G1A0_9BACT|nr:uroporphyrinogen-III synthase [Rhizosphaericola mali]QES89574.1 uroporphyrinogen-III synthase [Rhizosphaericola mali]